MLNCHPNSRTWSTRRPRIRTTTMSSTPRRTTTRRTTTTPTSTTTRTTTTSTRTTTSEAWGELNWRAREPLIQSTDSSSVSWCVLFPSLFYLIVRVYEFWNFGLVRFQRLIWILRPRTLWIIKIWFVPDSMHLWLKKTNCRDLCQMSKFRCLRLCREWKRWEWTDRGKHRNCCLP